MDRSALDGRAGDQAASKRLPSALPSARPNLGLGSGLCPALDRAESGALPSPLTQLSQVNDNMVKTRLS